MRRPSLPLPLEAMLTARVAGLALLALAACDGPRVRQDLDFFEDAGAGGDRRSPDALPVLNADAEPALDARPVANADARTTTPLDARVSFDGRVPPDAGNADGFWPGDAVAPPDARGVPDAFEEPDAAEAPDAQTPPDAATAPDALSPPDAATAPDALLAPDAAGPPPERVLFGTARAADPAETVTVTDLATGRSTLAEPPDHRFALGPLPAAPHRTLAFSAAAHQTENVDWRVPDAEGLPDGPDEHLPDEVVLYRGRRVSNETAVDRLFFSGDDTFLLWAAGEALSAAATEGEGEGRVLVPAQYELFLGYTPAGTHAVVRRRSRPGLAGDIDAYPLAGGPAEPLFTEAQPWVRWLDDRALGMVQTQAALSQLVLSSPGAPGAVLAQGVPWLLVTRMQSGAVAYAAGEAPRYRVALDALGGQGPRVVSPPGAEAGDGFLMTSPDNRRLFWRTPEGTLWQYDQEADTARALAENVLVSPRPIALVNGGLYFWRGDVATHNDLFLLPAGAGGPAGIEPERRRAADVDGRTFVPTADGFYVAAPGRGLVHGSREGDTEAEVVVPARAVQFLLSGPGAIVLADGAAFTHVPGARPTARGGDGLAQLEIAPRGATAWAAATGSLFFIPAPEEGGRAAELSRGGVGPARVTEPARSAIYVRDTGPWRRWSLPPAEGETGAAFGVDAPRLLPLTPAQALELDAAGALLTVATEADGSLPWAWNVTAVERGPRRDFAAYVCDRGVFVVPLTDAAP